MDMRVLGIYDIGISVNNTEQVRKETVEIYIFFFLQLVALHVVSLVLRKVLILVFTILRGCCTVYITIL